MQELPAGVSRVVHQLDRVMRKTAVAAVAGAGLMLAASQSHAVVVYSGTVNLAVPASTNGLYLNVVTGANNLPPPGTAGSTVAGWDINVWSSTVLNLFSNSNVTAVAGTSGSYVVSVAGTAANLATGAIIDSSRLFGSSTTSTPWVLNSSDNVFGFRFVGEDNLLHYGWARLSIGAALTTRTLVEYAYESTPGLGITVTSVPEPATYAMMGAGIAGLLLARRRRSA